MDLKGILLCEIIQSQKVTFTEPIYMTSIKRKTIVTKNRPAVGWSYEKEAGGCWTVSEYQDEVFEMIQLLCTWS